MAKILPLHTTNHCVDLKSSSRSEETRVRLTAGPLMVFESSAVGIRIKVHVDEPSPLSFILLVFC